MLEYQLHSYKEKWVVDTVQRAVGRLSHKITDTTRVERRIMIRVGRYISEDAGNVRNRRHIGRLIFREVNDAVNLYRREHAEYISDLTSTDEDGQAVEYDPQDVLANVEAEVMVKETIALLAQNDRRNKMILNAWANGETNDAEISRGLASALGGTPTGHLSHIKRFKNECRTQLYAQAI